MRTINPYTLKGGIFMKKAIRFLVRKIWHEDFANIAEQHGCESGLLFIWIMTLIGIFTSTCGIYGVILYIIDELETRKEEKEREDEEYQEQIDRVCDEAIERERNR